MAQDGIITRKEIITDDALNWSDLYVKNLDAAVNKNKEFVNTIKEIANSYSKIGDAKTFVELQKASKEATDSANKAQKEATQLKEQDLKIERLIIQLERERLALSEAQRKATESQNKVKSTGNKLTVEERLLNEQNNKQLKAEAAERLGLIGAYQKLNKERTEAKRKVMDLIAEGHKETKQLKEAQKEFDNLDKRVKNADKAVGDFTKNVGNYPFKSIALGVKDLIGAFGFTAGVGALAMGLQNAWKTIKEFDTALTELSAVTEVPKKQLGSLKNVIVDVSKTSVNSATDIAKLAVELSKLGASTTDIEKMIGTVDKFAVAMEAGGDESAQFLLGVMNSFGASAEEAEHYGDVMANAANISALGFNELVNSMKYVAPVANAANVSLERVTAMTGLLVDNNLDASQAGTALRSIMLRLAKDGMTYEQAMQKINNSTDKLATATKLFGTEASTAALILSGNNEKLAEYEAKLNNSAGALEKLNATKMDSLENTIKAMGSAWDAMILSIEDGNGAISNFVKTAVKGLTFVINAITEANKSWADLGGQNYSNSLSQETSTIDELVRENAIRSKRIELMQKEKLSFSDATFAANLYYSTNKKELDALIEKEKQGFKDSSIYGSGISSAQKNLDAINKKIAEQTQLIERLKGERSETGIIANIVLGTRAEIKRAEKELNKMILTQKTFMGVMDAYKQYGSSTPLSVEQQKVADEEDEKAKKKRLKSEEYYLKRLQELARAKHELDLWRMNRAKELNAEILADEEKTLNEQIDAYMDNQQLEESIAREIADYKLREISRDNSKVRDLTDEEIETLLKGGEIKKQLLDSEVLVLEQYQAARDDIARRQEKNLQKIMDLEVKRQEKALGITSQGISIAEDSEIQAENNRFRVELGDGLSFAETERATEAHLKRLNDIKYKYRTEDLQNSIEVYGQLMQNENLSLEERKKAEQKYWDLKKQLSEIDLERTQIDNEKRLEQEKMYHEQMQDLYMQLKDALVDLTNAIFDARIQRIDDDIAKSEEYYARQIELAGEDQVQKDMLEAEAEKKRKALEEKKRKEQIKQAIFEKAMKVFDIGMATALGIMQAYAQLGVFATPAAAMIGVLGTVQTAAVLAAPIPKYKDGRKDGPDEFAIVGDGGRSEVIERKSGGFEITPAYDTLTYLNRGDKVHKSVDDFLSSKGMDEKLLKGQSKMDNFQNMIALNFKDKESLEELRNITKAIKSQRVTIKEKSVNFDINHKLWSLNQTKWS